MSSRRIICKKNENSRDMITEDDIASWVEKKGGIVLTRKIASKNINFSTNYVCLTGYENIIKKFQKMILPGIVNTVILILLESDNIVIPNTILNHPKIKKIFQWNKKINHHKVSCIPIGINKDRHLESLLKIESSKEKKRLLLKNFNTETHGSREKLMKNKNIDQLSEKIPHFNPKREYYSKSFSDGRIKIIVTAENFYEQMNDFKFVLSPRGAGEDCHRTWEALYLGCIPIVLSSCINELYEDLPVLIINDWSELSEQLLEKTWEDYKDKEWNFEKLNLNYWFKQFEDSVRLSKPKKHIIVTTTNENKTYCGFVPSVYQMWKKNFPECHFVLGVVSNRDKEDPYIKRLEEFSDDFYLFKNEKGVDSGVQAKVSRLYMSTLYEKEVVTIVDVDQYIFDFEWLREKLNSAFDRKFVTVAYEAYIKTKDRGKWPMPYTTAPSDIFKKIVNYNNIDNYIDWLDSLRKIQRPIDGKESIENKFDNYSDESTLRYLLERNKERDYIYSIWNKVRRLDATVYNRADRRLDRWAWENQFSHDKLNNNYYFDSWPIRPFEKNYHKLEPLLKHMHLDLSKDKIFLNG